MAIGDRYVSMQVCDEGFEYSIFDTDYYLQDGGIVAVPTSIIGAMYIVIQDHCMFEEPMEQIDFETLFEKTSKQELSKIEKAMNGENTTVKPSIVQTLKDTEKVPENKKNKFISKPRRTIRKERFDAFCASAKRSDEGENKGCV